MTVISASYTKSLTSLAVICGHTPFNGLAVILDNLSRISDSSEYLIELVIDDSALFAATCESVVYPTWLPST